MEVHMMRALMEVLTEAVKRQEDDAVLRDIVADSRRRPPNTIEPALTSGAGRVGLQGVGMVHEVSLDNWHPPGQAIFDKLMDDQDKQDKAARAIRGGV
jgi:hypothetical protein